MLGRLHRQKPRSRRALGACLLGVGCLIIVTQLPWWVLRTILGVLAIGLGWLLLDEGR